MFNGFGTKPLAPRFLAFSLNSSIKRFECTDDWTDEDLFKVLPENSYSIKVGLTQSHAKFNLRNYVEVINLLEDLTK